MNLFDRPTPRVAFAIVRGIADQTRDDGIVIDEEMIVETRPVASPAVVHDAGLLVKRGEFRTLVEAENSIRAGQGLPPVDPYGVGPAVDLLSRPGNKTRYIVSGIFVAGAFIAVCACIGYLVGG